MRVSADDPGPSPTTRQVLELACAYGLAIEAPPPPPERPEYVPYCEDTGTQELQAMSQETRLRAARLWAEGYSIKRIASTLGLSFEAIKTQVCKHRELFPYRRGPYTKRKGASGSDGNGAS